MMTIACPPLPPDTHQALLELQARIDALPAYADRVTAGATMFGTQNRRDNATFQKVRETLGAGCKGAQRCMYCEDSAADQIDHIWPKAFFPNLVFSWMNFLYACGACNVSKQHRFSLLSGRTSQVVELVRRRGEPVVEPEAGQPILVDPRRDDPFRYLTLDLLGTFHFAPVHSKGTHEYERAAYTIELLRLNDREYLPAARREAYGTYVARLKEYLSLRGSGDAAARRDALLWCAQPTVWAEMVRQADRIPELKRLFDAAPEARSWQRG